MEGAVQEISFTITTGAIGIFYVSFLHFCPRVKGLTSCIIAIQCLDIIAFTFMGALVSVNTRDTRSMRYKYCYQ